MKSFTIESGRVNNMLKIERKVMRYENPETGLEVNHYALIAHEAKYKVLLSHPNLFLYSSSRSSIKTSSRYSNVISMFYRFISTQEKFKKHRASQYHAISDNSDIKRWQVSRQVARVAKQSTKPSSETIYEDAKIILFFFIGSILMAI